MPGQNLVVDTGQSPLRPVVTFIIQRTDIWLQSDVRLESVFPCIWCLYSVPSPHRVRITYLTSVGSNELGVSV